MARRTPWLPRGLDLAVDVGVWVALAATMLVECRLSDDPGSPITPWTVTVILASVAPLLVRRSHPLVAVVGCFLGLFAIESVVEIYQTIPFPPMVAAYSLARVVERRRAALLGLVLAVVVLVDLAVVSPHSLVDIDTPKNLAFVALPIVLGVAARSRADYLTALVERAETAERTREQEALRRVDEERLRIARDLHDAVAHALVAINVQAGVAAHVRDTDPETNRTTFREIKRVSGEALADLRGTLGILRGTETAAPTAPTNTLADLDELGARLGAAGVDVRLDLDGTDGTDGTDSSKSLPAAVDATGYRIVQEALTNVMRHAGPTTARVCVRRQDHCLLVDVEDDGASGPRAAQPGSGHGVRGMRERALAAGGSLEAGPRPEGGWRVRATLPLDQPVLDPHVHPAVADSP